jgi:uncharacterized protein with PIN domain
MSDPADTIRAGIYRMLPTTRESQAAERVLDALVARRDALENALYEMEQIASHHERENSTLREALERCREADRRCRELRARIVLDEVPEAEVAHAYAIATAPLAAALAAADRERA